MEKIPAEVGCACCSANEGLQDAKLIPIEDGQQFLLYGGAVLSFQCGTIYGTIWKYTVNNNVWVEIGGMMEPREEHSVLPVENMECPKH